MGTEPTRMARGLDHIVHAVHDLDAAARLYERFGFVVGARNRHPWGTHNRIVQLDRFFVEVLTIGEPDRIPPHRPGAFSFGAFHRDFLARHEGGLAMLLLEARDPAGDAAAFAAAGIGCSGVFRFERQGRRPDGSAVDLAFSLVFATDPQAPEIGFASCQHHFPENFWSPALQAHANRATTVCGIAMVAENPSEHHIFLSAFTGERELLATSSGVTVTTPRGFIQVMEPSTYANRFGVPAPEVGRGARLAAVIVSVHDVAAVAAILDNAKVPRQMRMGRVVVGLEAAMGAAIVFTQA